MQMPSVSKEFWIFGGVIFVLLCVGLFLQLVVFRDDVPVIDYTNVILEEETVSVPVDGQLYKLVAGTDARGEFLLEPNSLWKVYTNIVPRELEVDWYDAPKFIDLNSDDPSALLFAALSGDIERATENLIRTYGCDETNLWVCTFYIYEMGKISTTGGWFDRPVYRIFLPQFGMGTYSVPFNMLFDTATNKFILLDPSAFVIDEPMSGSQYTVPIQDDAHIMSRFILGSAPSMISNEPTASFPKELPVGEHGLLLFVRYEYKEREVGKFANWWGSRTPDMNEFGIYDMTTGERNPVLRTPSMFKTDEYGTVFMDRGAFLVDDSDTQSRALYEFIPYFMQWPEGQESKDMYAARFVPAVNWTDGRQNVIDTFVLGGTVAIGGCQHGVVPFTNIVSDDTWFSVSDLKQVGATKEKGEPVYVIADPRQHPYYKELFAYGFEGSQLYNAENYEERRKQLESLSDEEKYTQFLADNPVFFWKDSMGNWRVYQKSKYQSMAECGKPVIYLYPEQTTDVNVQVAPNGGFTQTIPEYPNGGWNVKAEPNGALTSYDDGQPYPYLFWEGHANGFEYSDKGFVFTQDGVESGMKDVLARFGMNEQETADFLEFWLPKMVEKPYVFVTFADQRDFERAAPLKIAPKPDSVLRVFMYFEGLDVPRVVEPLTIRPFARTGFSVVEWGGVLVR